MKKEIERKFLDFDKEKLLKRLGELGFKKVFEGMLYTSFYSPSSELFKEYKWLRIREIIESGKSPRLFITIKQHKFNSTNFEQDESEWELKGPSRKEFEERLESVGLKLFLRVDKRRVSYVLEGKGRVEFDKPLGNYDAIPEYVELETDSEDSLKELADLLGLDLSKGYNGFNELRDLYNLKEYVE